MVITQPTVDDFSDTTVMRVIRKIVNYICNDLVDGINNNDIVSGEFSIQGDQLSGTLTKGDGTTIDIPAATLPSGGGSDNPYPTAVSMTLSGTTLNFSMTMSSGSPITASVDLSSLNGGNIDFSNVLVGTNSEGNITSLSAFATALSNIEDNKFVSVSIIVETNTATRVINFMGVKHNGSMQEIGMTCYGSGMSIPGSGSTEALAIIRIIIATNNISLLGSNVNLGINSANIISFSGRYSV